MEEMPIITPSQFLSLEGITSNDFDVRIASLPKVELHLHLEGAIRRQTLRELACQSDTPVVLGELPWERRGFRYNDLSHFLTTARAILSKFEKITLTFNARTLRRKV